MAFRKKNGLIYSEMYYGGWKENKRDKNGIYIWIDEPLGNEQFDSANFDAYVGLIENDTFKRGTYLSKNGDDYFLYHGNFDNELKKTDDNAFYYSSKYDRLLHGKIKKMFLFQDMLHFLTLNREPCKISYIVVWEKTEMSLKLN